MPDYGQRFIKTDAHLRRVEDILMSGVPQSRAERLLQQPHPVGLGLGLKQVKRLIEQVHERWELERIAFGPRRREAVYRQLEVVYAEARSKGELGVASGLLQQMMKASGGTRLDPAREAAVRALGHIPKDPTKVLMWAQQCMLLALQDVMTSPDIEPERRLRWVKEFGAAIGMTHAKALVEDKLDRLEGRVYGSAAEPPSDDLSPLEGIEFPSYSGFGASDDGSRSLPGHGPDPHPPEDGGGAAGGGGSVGSP